MVLVPGELVWQVQRMSDWMKEPKGVESGVGYWSHGWRERGGVPVPKRGGIEVTAGVGLSVVGKNCSGAAPVV